VGAGAYEPVLQQRDERAALAEFESAFVAFEQRDSGGPFPVRVLVTE
jgi:hypothetical protein